MENIGDIVRDLREAPITDEHGAKTWVLSLADRIESASKREKQLLQDELEMIKARRKNLETNEEELHEDIHNLEYEISCRVEQIEELKTKVAELVSKNAKLNAALNPILDLNLKDHACNGSCTILDYIDIAQRIYAGGAK